MRSAPGRAATLPGDEAHGFDPGVDGLEAQRLEEPEPGQREDLEGDLHDHPGRPLGAKEEVAQIRSDGGPRTIGVSTRSPVGSTTESATTRSSMLP